MMPLRRFTARPHRENVCRFVEHPEGHFVRFEDAVYQIECLENQLEALREAALGVVQAVEMAEPNLPPLVAYNINKLAAETPREVTP